MQFPAVLQPLQTALTVPCSELHQQMVAFAAGLRSLGVQAGDRVSLFSENSSRWLVADQGIMFNGAADAVRPSAAAPPISALGVDVHQACPEAAVIHGVPDEIQGGC